MKKSAAKISFALLFIALSFNLFSNAFGQIVQMAIPRAKNPHTDRNRIVAFEIREQRRVAELMGKLEWDDSFDYKAERSRK